MDNHPVRPGRANDEHEPAPDGSGAEEQPTADDAATGTGASTGKEPLDDEYEPL